MEKTANSFNGIINLILPKYYISSQETLENNNYIHYKKPPSHPTHKQQLPSVALNVLDIQQQQQQQQDQIQQQSPLALPPQISLLELKQKLHSKLSTFPSSQNTPKNRQEIIAKRLLKKSSKKSPKKSSSQNQSKPSIPSNPSPPASSQDSSSINPFNIDFGTQNKRKRSSDIHSKLSKAIHKKTKLESLKQSDPEKATEIISNQKWAKMQALASGEKVLDNVQLLQKTLKRKTVEKKKSAQDWNQRKDHLQNKLKAIQAKRQENIQARKDLKNAPKGKKNTPKKDQTKKVHASKNKSRPGFEGKQNTNSGKGKGKLDSKQKARKARV